MDYLFMETNLFVVDSYNPNENITEMQYGSTCKYHHPKERHVTLAAGTLSSQGLPLRLLNPAEVTGIMNDFAEPGSLAPTGLFLGSTKYMVLQGLWWCYYKENWPGLGHWNL